MVKARRATRPAIPRKVAVNKPKRKLYPGIFLARLGTGSDNEPEYVNNQSVISTSTNNGMIDWNAHMLVRADRNLLALLPSYGRRCSGYGSRPAALETKGLRPVKQSLYISTWGTLFVLMCCCAFMRSSVLLIEPRHYHEANTHRDAQATIDDA